MVPIARILVVGEDVVMGSAFPEFDTSRLRISAKPPTLHVSSQSLLSMFVIAGGSVLCKHPGAVAERTLEHLSRIMIEGRGW
jgi:hypothetical protein